PQSSILYPTVNPQSKEARIEIREPVSGRHLGQVCLRPVLMQQLEQLVAGNNASATMADRIAMARSLAFGPPSSR
ncbi:MAG: hypothetical protein ACKPJD_32230, partial [Planctomycetaceae bacterium]